MKEIHKVVAHFPKTINLLFRNFLKQATLVASVYEAAEAIVSPDSGKIHKRSGKTAESSPWKTFLLKIVCQ